MSWSFDTVESWVNTALMNLGYTAAQAQLGAQSVTWLQQRHAPGVAALAQHIDFISAYKFTPTQGGDKEAHCPIVLSDSLQSHNDISEQTFQNVRQPLLLLPTLAKFGGVVRWEEFETDLTTTSLDIEYERKSLRKVLLTSVDVQWVPTGADEFISNSGLTRDVDNPANTDNLGEINPQNAPSNRHSSDAADMAELATEILSRELVYVKTVQHYAGTLPPPEPLDNNDDTDNTSSA